MHIKYYKKNNTNIHDMAHLSTRLLVDVLRWMV